MGFDAFLRSRIRNLIRRFGWTIRNSNLPEPSYSGALMRLHAHGIPFETVIDIGASNGSWSKELETYFPGKNHLLVDANAIHQPALEKVCADRKSWIFRITAVGGAVGTLFFDGSDPFGGVLRETPFDENYKPCAVTTVDQLITETHLQGPYLLKLDTHGVEVPILKGAASILRECNLLVVEAYNFTFGYPAVPFWELCQFLLGLGFRPLDVFDILYREVDDAFWQFDLLFARADLPLFKDYRYFRTTRESAGGR